MKNIKILSELGHSENKALLCEIPADWSSDIPIAKDGSIDAMGLLKLIRKSIITEHLSEQKNQRDAESVELSEEDAISLYEMIYNPSLAVNPILRS